MTPSYEPKSTEQGFWIGCGQFVIMFVIALIIMYLVGRQVIEAIV